MKEFDIDGEAIEAAAAKAAEIYADLFRGLESRPVSPGISSEELASVFEDSIPERGVGLVRAIEEFREKIVPASMATPHPLYLGLVNCSPLPAAPLADLLVSALNNNNGAAGQGPAAAAAEREIVAAFSRLTFGHGESSGMMLPGGSYATLQALTMARARHFPEWSSLGPASVKSRPVLYTSDASHFSVSRAGHVLGLGKNGVTSIGTRGRGAIDRDALEETIERDRAAGARPFAVVATLGTTGTGAIDPVAAIADCCRRHGLWLHVDACYGGGALLLDRFRTRFSGIEHADSIALDPHKWFFLPLTHSLLLVRDPGAEQSTFEVGATYIPHQGKSGRLPAWHPDLAAGFTPDALDGSTGAWLGDHSRGGAAQHRAHPRLGAAPSRASVQGPARRRAVDRLRPLGTARMGPHGRAITSRTGLPRKRSNPGRHGSPRSITTGEPG